LAGIKILGTGYYVPENIVKNEDFAKIVETSDEWITTRTGIKERHLVTDETTWQMGVYAAKQALDRARLSAGEVDLIIFTTCTPDFFSPSMSCLVQREIGAFSAMCIDVNCACTGFVYGLDMARRYLLTGDVKTVLMVSSEGLSKLTDFSDRSTCVLFGDGAGALAVQKEENALYSSFLKADSRNAGVLFARALHNGHPFGGSAVQADDFVPGNQHYLYMNGKEVYKFAIKAMPEAVTGACKKIGLSVSELDWIIPHQANVRIVETAAQKLQFPSEKIYVNLQNYGNTSSASIAIALHEMDEKGLLQKGQKLCIVGFGAGLTYGAAVFEW